MSNENENVKEEIVKETIKSENEREIPLQLDDKGQFQLILEKLSGRGYIAHNPISGDKFGLTKMDEVRSILSCISEDVSNALENALETSEYREFEVMVSVTPLYGSAKTTPGAIGREINNSQHYRVHNAKSQEIDESKEFRFSIHKRDSNTLRKPLEKDNYEYKNAQVIVDNDEEVSENNDDIPSNGLKANNQNSKEKTQQGSGKQNIK